MYNIGQTVIVRTWTGEKMRATIIAFGEKNDRKLYDLDNGHWCYEDQIIKVITN